MATITAESVTNRTEVLVDEVISEILSMDDGQAVATIEQLQQVLEQLRPALHPTNIEPLFETDPED
jgi:hypothetical protein